MDNVLVPYLTAGDHEERQLLLDELLTLRAAPLIRQVLRRRLGFFVSARGINENNQDAEDLWQEAITRVVQELNELQSSSGPGIENFELYVSRLAENICTDFLRANSPARTRLKYRLRDLLKRHQDLVSWEHNGEILCGFTPWQNTGKSAFSVQSTQDIEAKLNSFTALYFADEDIRLAPVSQIVAELFNWIGGPIEIDVLVRMIAHLLDLKDQPTESLDDPSLRGLDLYLADNTQSSESGVAANELLKRLWQAVIRLPKEQRDAFAFGFEDHIGQDLFTLLLAMEIVNLNELARGMDRSIEEVAQLRLRMPMDNASVAVELGASRGSIYKWRFRAIRRLEIELRAGK